MANAADYYRVQRTQFDPGMGLDEICDALNLGLYIGSTAPNAPINSSLISFLQSGTGSIATDLQTRGRLEVWSADKGHSPSASAAVNDAALLAAIQQVYDAGGGTVRIASGNYSHINTSFEWLAAISVTLRGAGKKATYLTKSGATSTDVLSFSADIGVLDTHSALEDMSIVGNAKGHPGVTATNFARFTTKNIGITACSTGWNSVGCLIVKHDNPTFNSNAIGFKSRKSAGGIYCNLTLFDGGEVRANSSFGYDIGDASGFLVRGTDIEANGTTTDTATGQVIIRDTVDDATGYANIVFDGAWFEDGLGENFKVEAAGGLMLTLRDCPMISSEAGRVMNVGAIDTLILQNITAGSSGDTATIAATNCIIDGGVIYTLTDTSTNKNHRNVTTNAGLTQLQVTGSGGTVRLSDGAARTSGGATASTNSGVAVTLFTATAAAGLYVVYAYLSQGGSSYTTYGMIATDDANTAVIITKTDASNMVLSVSGLDVQATQTSGTAQVLRYQVLKIA